MIDYAKPSPVTHVQFVDESPSPFNRQLELLSWAKHFQVQRDKPEIVQLQDLVAAWPNLALTKYVVLTPPGILLDDAYLDSLGRMMQSPVLPGLGQQPFLSTGATIWIPSDSTVGVAEFRHPSASLLRAQTCPVLILAESDHVARLIHALMRQGQVRPGPTRTARSLFMSLWRSIAFGKSYQLLPGSWMGVSVVASPPLTEGDAETYEWAWGALQAASQVTLPEVIRHFLDATRYVNRLHREVYRIMMQLSPALPDGKWKVSHTGREWFAECPTGVAPADYFVDAFQETMKLFHAREVESPADPEEAAT